MSEYKVALRYAKSLLEEAVKDKLEDGIKADMGLIVQTIEDNRELRIVLSNPIIKSDKKLAILKAIFGKKINKLSEKFIQLVCRKERAEFMSEIAQEYLNQYNYYKNINKASVVTAISLNEELKAEFKAVLEKGFGKTIELNDLVNKDIIGGYILKMNDRQVDDSIRNRLNQLKLKLIDQSYKALV